MKKEENQGKIIMSNPLQAFGCKLKKVFFFFASIFLLFPLFSLFEQNMLKKHMLNSILSVQHPNAGRNIQQLSRVGLKSEAKS